MLAPTLRQPTTTGYAFSHAKAARDVTFASGHVSGDGVWSDCEYMLHSFSGGGRARLAWWMVLAGWRLFVWARRKSEVCRPPLTWPRGTFTTSHTRRASVSFSVSAVYSYPRVWGPFRHTQVAVPLFATTDSDTLVESCCYRDVRSVVR